MSEKIEKGYLYISSGEKYVKEAITSATSLRKVNHDAHITLVTDKAIENNIFNIIKVRLMNYSMYDKVHYIYEESPYERTFYIDGDTYFYSNCDELFNLLDYFDICMTEAPAESEFIQGVSKIAGYVPYSTGCIVFRKDSITESFFKSWQENHVNIYKGAMSNTIDDNDQFSFAATFLNTEIKIYTLPENWHMRFMRFNVINNSVKMVHGRGVNYEKIESILNSITDLRCWDPYRNKIIYKPLIVIIQENLRRLIWSVYCYVKKHF